MSSDPINLNVLLEPLGLTTGSPSDWITRAGARMVCSLFSRDHEGHGEILMGNSDYVLFFSSIFIPKGEPEAQRTRFFRTKQTYVLPKKEVIDRSIPLTKTPKLQDNVFLDAKKS